MPDIAEFTDPRLVAIYDAVNAYEPGTQPDFYRGLALELGAGSIVDIGCGTGLVTRELAAAGFRMTGVDPSAAMIDAARRGPFGDQVDWIVGDASRLEPGEADLAIMTGHVAQFFLSDASWLEALAGIRRALRPGGRVAFESRNPQARGWDAWTRAASTMVVEDEVAGGIEAWSEVDEVSNSIVSYANHYAFASGEHLVSPNRLRFRSEQELRGSLEEAGFAMECVYGDWDRRPTGPAERELIVVAVRG